MSRIFYVCSYGGSGSTMLTNYLAQFGQVYHVHGRYPPKRLTKLVDAISDNVSNDAKWFSDEELSSEELERTSVIFIYRNPAKAINSRFLNPFHLQNIQLKKLVTLNEVLRTQRDLYGIEEFYHNYVDFSEERNYPILCVKYETLFDNWHQLNNALQLPYNPSIEFPENRERKIVRPSEMNLYWIYRPLVLHMIAMPPIYWVKNGVDATNADANADANANANTNANAMATSRPLQLKTIQIPTKSIPTRDLRKLTTSSNGKAGVCWKKAC